MVIGLVGGSIGILTVAFAPNIPVVLVGWCLAQVCFNAMQAALVAVLPDQVPAAQRGQVSGVLGVCLPIASVGGTFLVQLFAGNQFAMFAVPCAIGAFFILLFAVTLKDRRLATADKPPWSLREFAGTFYVNPRQNPDFAWAFASRFMFLLAYAFLATYQAYYLLDKIGSAEADVPRQIFLGTLVQSSVIVAASVIGGRLSDRTGRRKIFVADCGDRVRPGDVRGRRRQRLQRFSRRHGHRRTRLRHVRGRRSRARRRRAAGQGQAPRISASSTSPPRCPSPSRRRSRRPSWRSAAAATPCCTGRRGLRRQRSRRHPAGEGGPLSGAGAGDAHAGR